MFTPFSFLQQPPTSSTIPTLLVGGAFTKYNQPRSSNFIKLTPSGEIDATFNVSSSFNATVYAIATQPDGKVLVGGDFTSYSGSSSNRIIRLNTNGTIDTTFNIGTGFDNRIETIITFPDNSCLVGGNFLQYSGSTKTYIARLSPSGSLTSSFAPSIQGFLGGRVNTLVTQSDGKIIAGGAFTNYGAVNYLIALSSSGDQLNLASFNIGTGFSSQVLAMVTQSDGKIIVGGNFTSYSGSTSNYIIRLNPDGTRDTTYNIGTGFNSTIQALVIQSDNKVIAGGQFTSYSGSANNYIVRLNTNGTKDTSYVIGTGFDSIPRNMALQNDDKVYIVGSISIYSGSANNFIVRINTNGTKDTTFNPGTGFGSLTFAVAVQSDNKAIVGGQYTTYSGSSVNRIVRLNTDGTIDNTFNIGTGANGIPSAITVDNLGKVIAIGGFTTYSGSSNNGMVRINPDGTKDNTLIIGTGFDPVGASVPSFLKLDNTGGIYVGSNFTTYSGSTVNNIVKLQPSGAIDTTFSAAQTTSQGAAGFDSSVTAGIISGSRVYLGGAFTSFKPKNRILRLNADGTIDTSFQLFSGFENTVQSIAVQSDGKIIVGGNFGTYSGSSNSRIVRLNSNGTKDTTYNIGIGFDNPVYNLKNDPSTNNTYVAGTFITYSGSNAERLTRLLPSGTRDTSFITSTGLSNFQNSQSYLDLDSNGMVLVGSSFNSYSGSTVNSFIRILNNGNIDPNLNYFTTYYNGRSVGFEGTAIFAGTLDNSGNIYLGGAFSYYKSLSTNCIASLTLSGSLNTNFNMGAGANNVIYSMVTQSDGGSCVVGTFTSYNNIARSYVAFLNDNGTLNPSVNIGTGFNNAVYSVAAQSDGKIIAVGAFTTYSGSTSNYIVRINTNGTRDTTFNVGTGLGFTAYSLAIQSDGKIIAGGQFGTYSGSNSSGLVRINTDGTIDSTFNVGTGTSLNIVYGIGIQSDSKIIAAGNFTSYSGSSINRIMRLNTNGTIDTTYNVGTGLNGLVSTLKLQPDGKAIAIGQFNLYSASISSPNIIRINTNGTRDATFNIGTGMNGATAIQGQCIEVDSNNSIYLGGSATVYSGSVFNYITKLTPSGAIDTTFNTGANNIDKGFNSHVYALILK